MEETDILSRRGRMTHSQKSTLALSVDGRNYGTISDNDNPFEVGEVNNLEDISIDTALNRIKTYKWFFWLCIIPMILSFSFSDMLVDSLSYLELIPIDMECKTTSMDQSGSNIWIPCTKDNICNPTGSTHFEYDNGNIVFRKSQDDYYTLNNWVESMHMECRNGFQIGALGSMAFIGMAIGSVIGAIFSLMFGRKLIYIAGLVLTVGAAFIVTVDPRYTTGMIALLVYGIGVFPRMTIGYVYALELTPRNATRTLGMLLFVGECFTGILSNFYLYIGGRNAIYFVYVWLFFSAIPLAFAFILPESPKYLHSNQEYEKSKQSLARIARLNGQWDDTFSDINLDPEISRISRSDIDKNAYFGLLELWGDRVTFRNTVAMAYLWGFYTFGHHWLIFMMKYAPGDKYTNGLLISIAVTIAPLLTRVIQGYLSSRNIYFLFSFLTTISSGLYLIVFNTTSTANIGATIMIIFIAIWIDAIGFTNYYVEFEYFNPKTATLAVGICSMTGRASAIFAPMVVEEFSDTVIIFFFLSIIAIFCVMFIEKPFEGQVRLLENESNDQKIKEMNW